MSTRIREVGATYLYNKGSDKPFAIPRHEYDRAITAWKQGHAFFETKDHHGTRCCVKLGEIFIIAETTAEAIAESRENAKADKAEDVTEGLDA